VHKVQLLDVATGTGTFIAEVVKQIYNGHFQNQQGMWSDYVEQHLLPRLHGFEILMASYAMCHMKIELLLEETGYKPKDPKKPPRLGVYLTNSLEEAHPDAHTLFASWLSAEANEASRIKKETPVMVAFGNPPYSVSSQNKGAWIQGLIADYKKGLNEKKLNLDDDYIKFIRYAEHYIEKTGYGIVAMITNNSYIDGLTHRQMRKHLLETFDTIYIYDLHGSAKKKETMTDGSADKNVFDIQQGVSISIFVKHREGNKELADVWHYDSYGTREAKYGELWDGAIKKTAFTKLEYKAPYYFFVPKDFEGNKNYTNGFAIAEIFNLYSLGVKTERDNVCIHFTRKSIEQTVEEFCNAEDDFIRNKYGLTTDSRDWSLAKARSDIQKHKGADLFTTLLYRAFDTRFTYYTGTSRGFIGTPGKKIADLLAKKNNYALLALRNSRLDSAAKFFITNTIANKDAVSSLDNCHCFPLYLYPTDNEQLTLGDKQHRTPNLDKKIVDAIAKKLGIPFVQDHEDKKADGKNAFSPLDLLDYTYAVLHSPSYRETYKEFLKIDFPRIPYPDNAKTFWQLVALGREIRLLHLLESPILAKLITSYPVGGDNKVEKPEYKTGKVYINKEQYFDTVPQEAWDFYIGGYQPAQKWLKDRKGRTLNFDDITHYQKIIVALVETDRLMKEIDAVWKP